MTTEYAFDGLPLDGVRPGTSVLLTGPAHAGTREFGLRMLTCGADEGVTIVTTNQRAARIADDSSRLGVDVDDERMAIIDCVGGEDADCPARVVPVANPGDMTGIGMRNSDVLRGFKRAGISRVRTGLFSISTLLSFSDLKTVSRFVHTFVGHIDSLEGLGVFLINPANHDDRAVSTLSQFCTARIDVRETDDASEFRSRGLAGQSREWRSFEP